MDRGEGEPGRAADEVIDLLGRFVRDERVIACLTRLGAAEPYLTIEGAFAAYGRPEETGLSLSAMSLAEFRGTFGEPRSTVGGAQDALILSRIDFSDADCAAPGSRAYDGPLPFGLRFGDPGAAVGERLGAKPRRKDRSGDLPGRSPVAFVWEYHVGALSVIAKLTAQQRLAALYLAPLGRTARQAREREAGLEAASATIDPDCGPRIEALRAALPRARWREAAAEPDSDMVVEEIAVAEGALHRYLNAVRAAAAQRSAPLLYGATERLVRALNRLNRRNGLIETLERDELGELIDAALTAAGLERAEGEDITLIWREW